MVIDKSNGTIKIIADEGKKITNRERTIFVDYIYLGKNDSINNYQEVPREIWKHFIEDNDTDFDILQEKISDNSSMIANLEELLLDTDFRLMCLEIEKEYKEM